MLRQRQSSTPPNSDIASTGKILWKVFFAALAIRWASAIALFAAMGEKGLLGGPDSLTYIDNSRRFAATIVAGAAHGWGWLGPDPVTMPLFAWLMTSHTLLFGTSGIFTYVLMQGALDSVTCLLICGLARSCNPHYALPAAVAAALNPTQIIFSGVALTDTPFLFFVALYLYATVRWLHKPAARWAVLIGIALGGAALVRVLIVPFAAASIIFLLIVLAVTRRLSLHNVAQVGGVVLIVCGFLAPVLARNVSHYGTWALTPQGGVHLAKWVVPLVKEANDRTPWMITFDLMEQRTRQRFGPPDNNPFEESRRYAEIGGEELRDLGIGSIAKAWMFGAAINLGTPAIILFPPIMQIPRTGFYATPGNSWPEKIANFAFRSDNNIYASVLLLGIAGVCAVRMIQMFGIAELFRNGPNWPAILLFSGWLGYILLINGPVASPKYRLPLEPIFAVLTGAGWCALRRANSRDLWPQT